MGKYSDMLLNPSSAEKEDPKIRGKYSRSLLQPSTDWDAVAREVERGGQPIAISRKKWAALLEAEKRGILTPKKAAMLQEARSRGLIPDAIQREWSPTSEIAGRLVAPGREKWPAVVQRNYVPTGEHHVGTLKPIMRATGGKGGTGAGVLTHAKAGWVKDPETRMRIYAEARGIPVERYRIQDGQIIFQADDGKWYSETPEGFIGPAKKAIGTLMSRPISTTLGTIGSLAGPHGAFLGAAGGRGVERGIGALAFEEPQTVTGNLVDMGVEGSLAAGGELVGRLVAGGTNALRFRKGGALKHAMGREIKGRLLSPEDHARAKFIKALAQENGIKLAPHQIYNKEGMTNIWKYLRKHPQTSDAVKAFEDQLAGQVEDATERYLGRLAPPEDVSRIGGRLVDASKATLESARRTRSKAVRPMYDKAFREVPEVDISTPLSEIDQLIASAPTGPAKNTLKTVKSFFLDDSGKPITDAKKIDWAKKQTDKYLKNVGDPNVASTDRQTMGMIAEIKDRIIGEIDRVNPEYAKARRVYGKLSPGVERLNQGAIGRIARMTDPRQMAKAARLLFAASNTTPALTRQARQILETRHPTAWRDALAGYLRDSYETLKTNASGDLVNAAGKMHKQLFGSKKQREILRAAMNPEQFKSLEDLMTVFKHAAVGSGSESMTMPFKAIDEQLTRNAGSAVYRLVDQPLSTVKEAIFGRWHDLILAGNQERLLQALMSDEATKTIRQMKRLSPGSEKQIRALGALLGKVGGDIGMEMEE